MDMDPENHGQWLHFHLQKCYTPYMDAMACLVDIKDKEISKMKHEAGPEGWKHIEKKWIHDVARQVGENKAKQMWEMSTNFKEIFEKTRQRDGHLYGEPTTATASGGAADNNNTALPRTMAEIMADGNVASINSGPPRNLAHERIETLMAMAKQKQLQQQRENEEKKSFWPFGGSSST